MVVSIKCGENNFSCELGDEEATRIFQETVVRCMGGKVKYEDVYEESVGICEPKEDNTKKLSDMLEDFKKEIAKELKSSMASTPKEIETTKHKPSFKSLGYGGFLRIKCGGCGKVKCFKPKTPLNYSYCYGEEGCGAKTDLTPIVMRELKYQCTSCGKNFKYMTNETDKYVVIECLECGALNDVKLDERHNKYVSFV